MIYMSRNSRVFTTGTIKRTFDEAIYMSRNSRVFTTLNREVDGAVRIYMSRNSRVFTTRFALYQKYYFDLHE